MKKLHWSVKILIFLPLIILSVVVAIYVSLVDWYYIARFPSISMDYKMKSIPYESEEVAVAYKESLVFNDQYYDFSFLSSPDRFDHIIDDFQVLRVTASSFYVFWIGGSDGLQWALAEVSYSEDDSEAFVQTILAQGNHLLGMEHDNQLVRIYDAEGLYQCSLMTASSLVEKLPAREYEEQAEPTLDFSKLNLQSSKTTKKIMRFGTDKSDFCSAFQIDGEWYAIYEIVDFVGNSYAAVFKVGEDGSTLYYCGYCSDWTTYLAKACEVLTLDLVNAESAN